MKFYRLGKRKVNVTFCSDAKKWTTDNGKSGNYYNVDIICPEFGEGNIRVTSNYKLKEGDQEVIIELHAGKEILKLKIRQEEKK